MALKKELLGKIDKLNETINTQNKDKLDLQKTIDSLEEKLKIQHGEYVDL